MTTILLSDFINTPGWMAELQLQSQEPTKLAGTHHPLLGQYGAIVNLKLFFPDLQDQGFKCIKAQAIKINPSYNGNDDTMEYTSEVIQFVFSDDSQADVALKLHNAVCEYYAQCSTVHATAAILINNGIIQNLSVSLIQIPNTESEDDPLYLRYDQEEIYVSFLDA